MPAAAAAAPVTAGAVSAAASPATPPGAAVDELGARLLAAAVDVFAERGYDGAGVAEIARRAGVTTGAIYSRFAGKADLLVAALEAQAPDQLDALFADHRFEGRMEDIIRLAGSHLVEDVADDGTALLLEGAVAARRNLDVAALMRDRIEERRQRLTEIIDTAKAEGGIAADLDTEALVTFCHAVGFGFLVFQAVGYPMPTTEGWSALITHLVAAIGRVPTGATAAPDTSKEQRNGD